MRQHLKRFWDLSWSLAGTRSRPARPQVTRRPCRHPDVEGLERRDCPSGLNDWPMYTHDPSGSRVSDSGPSPSAVAHAGLGVRWRFNTAGSISGTPAVVNRVVYDGDLKGNFYAIRDSPSGPTLLWQTNVGAPITDSPLVMQLPSGGSEVIFGDQAGYVYGLDVLTGGVNWRIRPNTSSPYVAIYGSATPITRGMITDVAIGVASNEEGVPLSSDHPGFSSRGSVVLLDPTNGNIVWQTDTITDGESAAGASGAGIWSTPTYDRQTGTIYVTTGNNYSKPATPTSDAIIALDAATGHIRWVYQATPNDTYNGLGGSSASMPDFDFGDSPKVYSLPDGTRVVGAGQKSGVYYVLDAATGKDVLDAATGKVPARPQLETGGALGGFFADSAVDQQKGLILANGSDWPHPETTFPIRGDLFAITSDGSREVWDFPTPFSPNITGVAVSNGVVYFQSAIDGSLYALDEGTGALLARVLTAGSSSGPAIANGRLYEGTGFAFGALTFNQDVSGSIVAIGPGHSPLPVYQETLREEQVNLAAIIQAFALQAGSVSNPGAGAIS